MKLSLKAKLLVMSMVLIVPFIIVTGFLVYQLNRVAASYDEIVRNITRANEYNTVFKENLDAVMYQMVARSLSKDEVEDEIGMPNPDTMIEEAKSCFEELDQGTTSSIAKERLVSIVNLLETLQKRADEINDTVKVSGHYDENMTRLDTDIRIITELVQERISEYIYYESVSMEMTRRDMEEQRNVLINAAILTVIATAVVTLILATIIMRSITKPIDELVHVTEEVARGRFDVRADVRQGDEISALASSFNSMTQRIGELVEHNRMEQINSRKLELKLLQAQINPHFLYNTLDNIVWLSEDDRKEDVASLVTSLSTFFRTTLSGGRDFIPLKEELSHIEAYLQIQQFRYRDILSYEITIPEEYYLCSIIKMTLQPIVENALYHGIKNKRGMGMIRITAGERGDRLVIIVEDDGIGMKEEELVELLRIIDGKQKPSPDNAGFGMSNVAERLRLNYGEGFGLAVDSVYGQGTKVEIFIPKKNIDE